MVMNADQGGNGGKVPGAKAKAVDKKMKKLPKMDSSTDEEEEEESRRREEARKRRQEEERRKKVEERERREKEKQEMDKQRLQQRLLQTILGMEELTQSVDKLASTLKITPEEILGVVNEDKSNARCEEGHDIMTDHNRRLLRQFDLESIDCRMLMKFLEPDSITPDPCWEYNLSGCKEDQCLKMHLCADYISGACKACELNHDVQEAQCGTLLRQANVKLSRSRKELRLAISYSIRPKAANPARFSSYPPPS
ncbi:unnamed protein product [Darwinula stevensoni]|uniref:C3H1-type domain-containing protein n=1 Tax=Darwinula stevensoni TaxID=69355 RepID=A0A7R9A526_9CRUS|nr:unnamed protein product [Darwinula stevensoni]CAG0891169.1 unnamed protein product [Darwinula stevensoni]